MKHFVQRSMKTDDYKQKIEKVKKQMLLMPHLRKIGQLWRRSNKEKTIRIKGLAFLDLETLKWMGLLKLRKRNQKNLHSAKAVEVDLLVLLKWVELHKLPKINQRNLHLVTVVEVDPLELLKWVINKKLKKLMRKNLLSVVFR